MKAFFSKIKPWFFVVLMVGLTQQLVAQTSGVVLRPLDVNPILINASNQDRMRVSPLQDVERPALLLPFFDDFSDLRSPFPNDSLWEDNLVFINASFPLFPPTIGVATFDALDASGRLYAHAASYTFPADTLTSRPIRLDSIFDENPRCLIIFDSTWRFDTTWNFDSLLLVDTVSRIDTVLTRIDTIIPYPTFISFYFQPGGGFGSQWDGMLRGRAPRVDDFLILEFRDDTAGWHTVWVSDSAKYWSHPTLRTLESFCPLCVDETATDIERVFFRQVAIPVSAEFFYSEFQFRFRSLNSLDPPGNRPVGRDGGGQWHIDYVRLDIHPDGFRDFSPDIAFVHQGERVLREFQAMPANQFLISDLVSEIPILFRNLDTLFQAVNYSFNIEGPNFSWSAVATNPEVWPFRTHGFNYDIDLYLGQRAFPNAFPERPDSGRFVFQHVLTGDARDVFQSNDTMIQILHLGNYFAFDDGTPELGFGLSAQADHPLIQFALQFPMRVADSLVGIQIWLNHTHEATNLTSFNLAVWTATDANGMPLQHSVTEGETLFLEHVYGDTIGFFTYWLDAPLALNPGDFFIGFQQRNNFFLNVGFDVNNNAENRMFRRINADAWEQIYMSGAVMMRPIFGTSATIPPPPPTNIVDRENIDNGFENIRVFPNPSEGIVFVVSETFVNRYELFDINGRRLLSQRVETGHAPSLQDDNTIVIDMSHLPSGVYILVLHTENGIVTQQIIRR